MRLPELVFLVVKMRWRAIETALARRLALRRLQAISDAGLKDIGVSRGNLEWVTQNGRRQD